MYIYRVQMCIDYTTHMHSCTIPPHLLSIVNENCVLIFNSGQHESLEEGSTNVGCHVGEHL